VNGLVRIRLSRVAFLALALVVVDLDVALGAVDPLWQELGGSASCDGISQIPNPGAAFGARVAVGANGRPVVVYTQYADGSAVQGAITVKRWTGTTWELMSGAGGIGVGYEPQVRIAADGAIYVAWLTGDASGNTQLRLRVWTGGSGFKELGGSDSPGGIAGNNVGIAAPFSLALDAAGRPMVAFPGVAKTGVVAVPAAPAIVDGTTQVYVRRWTGSSWAFVGSDFTGGGASQAVSFKSGSGTVVHDADMPSLTLDGAGAPVVAFTYYTTLNGQPVGNTDIFVARWNGSAWTALGPAVPGGDSAIGRGGAAGVSNSTGGSYNASLGAGPAGRLALAWEEDQPAGEIYVRVRVWNGTSWNELGGSATGSGFNQPGTVNVLPSIAVGPDGRPILAWEALTDFANPSQIFVRRWTTTGAWEEVGLQSATEGGISKATISAFGPSLALTPAGGPGADGTPAVAWLDIQDQSDGQVFLRQYSAAGVMPLTVRVAGSGTVTSNPAGVQCGPACTMSVPLGTTVTLTPKAAAGSTFSGWSGDCAGTGACAVTLTEPRSVTARFDAIRRLTVAVAVPTGARGQGKVGSIQLSSGSCAFGASRGCRVDVPDGTRLVLQATAAPGNRFLRWSGGSCHNRTEATCALTVTAGNQSTTGLFRGVTTVSVAKAGTGAGSVHAHNIACGRDCTESVFTGSVVTLRPDPAPGSTFVGWSGDACPTLLPSGACRFTASGLAKSFVATFRLDKKRPGGRAPAGRVEEVVLAVPPALCATSGGTLKEVPNGDSTAYVCIRTPR
jgi:List-Bact-rpt repeat protein